MAVIVAQNERSLVLVVVEIVWQRLESARTDSFRAVHTQNCDLFLQPPYSET